MWKEHIVSRPEFCHIMNQILDKFIISSIKHHSTSEKSITLFCSWGRTLITNTLLRFHFPHFPGLPNHIQLNIISAPTSRDFNSPIYLSANHNLLTTYKHQSCVTKDVCIIITLQPTSATLQMLPPTPRARLVDGQIRYLTCILLHPKMLIGTRFQRPIKPKCKYNSPISSCSFHDGKLNSP